MPYKHHKADTPNPIAPPKAHFLSPAVDLYNRPVVVPDNTVLISSSSPRSHCSRTPNPEYMTATVPKVFAVPAPCFIMWFRICVRRNLPVSCANVVCRTPL